jgi:ornithine cyclodeaminase/alanine dehydrogenase-like protein (mu-crystallin family)
MHFLNPKQTKHRLPFDSLIDALDSVFARDYEAPLRHHHSLPKDGEADAVLLLMPAWFSDGIGGVKIVNVVSGNTNRGLSTISSSYILFDRNTGEHLLVADGGELTARRTAAASALASKRIARSDSRSLLVVGAGRVGQNLPYAYREVLPIETVSVFDRNAKSAQALVSDLRTNGIDAYVADDLRASVRQADIISCATYATDPIIFGEWLIAGQHLDLIGSFTPKMREADDEAIRKADVFVDTEYALVESGDIANPIASGVLREEDICGTLADLCRNNIFGRSSDEQITLIKSVGSGIEDLAAAGLIYRGLS